VDHMTENAVSITVEGVASGNQDPRGQEESMVYLRRPRTTQSEPKKRKRVWLDIDNSPHVPFFVPIIKELERHDIDLVLTARNMYQVCDLLEFFHLPCRVVGGHYGKNKLLKIVCNCVRSVQLLPIIASQRPDLAVSHGSRAQVLVSKALGIPTMMMHDYEYSVKTGFLEPDWVLMPDVIPAGAMSKHADRVVRYPGLKEDVYTPGFRPDPSILPELGISPKDLVVTVRPPATEAHYHNPESDVLFAETMRLLGSTAGVRAIVLPRNSRQGQQLRADWKELIASGRVLIPLKPVDGLNVIWFSDLVVSGGGTMNREAAALGVPVYSIFRGKICAVDHYLEREGRLVLLENVQDVHTKIKLIRWNRPAQPGHNDRPVLQSIVATIVAVLESNDPKCVVQPKVSATSKSNIGRVEQPVEMKS
jgi:predicted glycosyltransferase